MLVELPQNHAGALGATILNPPADHPIGLSDQLLIVASDDSAIVLRDEPVAIPAATSGRTERVTPRTERQLLVGWTAKSRSFIVEYADYVEAGSRIDVIVADENVDPTPELEALAPSLNGTQVEILRLDPTDPDTWDSISPDRYQNIVILADDDDENAELIDAQTILILLLVRDRLPPEDERGDRHIPNLITELVGSENEALARQAGVHDFVVSPSFVSMLLAQISEEPKLYSVYRELFDKQGAEIYLKRADLYFDEMPDAVPFADLMAVAQSLRRGVPRGPLRRDRAAQRAPARAFNSTWTRTRRSPSARTTGSSCSPRTRPDRWQRSTGTATVCCRNCATRTRSTSSWRGITSWRVARRPTATASTCGACAGTASVGSGRRWPRARSTPSSSPTR